MSNQTSGFVGAFSGIHFGVKQKKGELVQTAGLNFDVELDETSLSQVTGIIGLQKQLVHLVVSRRQPSLFGDTPQPQGKLPLSGRNGDSPDAPPPPVDPSVATDILAVSSAPPPAGSIQGGDPTLMWHETRVAGTDGVDRRIFQRMDGLAFDCWECGGSFDLEPGDVLRDEIHQHACSDTDRACRVCGCTEAAPCPEGCSWVEQDLCSNPECLEAAGYTPEQIVRVEAGEVLAGPEMQSLEMTVKVPCRDGVVREFCYSMEHYQADRGPAFDCEACGELTEIKEGDQREFYPIPLMAAHVCPPVCHKCHAALKYGEAFASTLLFHHPECPKKDEDPDLEAVTSLVALGLDRIARRVETAPDSRASEFILEDATEAFARIEESCGLPRSVGRMDRTTYKGAQALTKKARKPILAAVKKASKSAWNRLEVLLQDIDAAKMALDEIAHKKQAEEQRKRNEQWKRQEQENAKAERERVAKVLAGGPQPYDEMLRQALCRGGDAQEAWAVAREQGMDRNDLRQLIAAALHQDGGLNVPGQTSISWKGGYYPKFWVGPATSKPTLEEGALVDEVRRIMQIPMEKEEPEEDVVDPERQPDAGEEEEGPEGVPAEASAEEPVGGEPYDFMLRHSLAHVENAGKRWGTDREEGLTDEELKTRIGVEFGIRGGSALPGHPFVSYTGGTNPGFWFQNMSVTGKPTLSGKILVAEVRRVMEIPFPAKVKGA